MLDPTSGRDGWIGGCRRHLRRREQGQFLVSAKLISNNGPGQFGRFWRWELTELSNLARLRRPPSTMFSTLISVFLRRSFVFPETELGAPSPLL
jgi:hypothetical protein